MRLTSNAFNFYDPYGTWTWIIGFSPFFPIYKPFFTGANLGGCQNRSLYLGAITCQLFSWKSSIFDNWQAPKYTSAYNESILFLQLRQCHKAEDFAFNTLSGIFSLFQWYQFWHESHCAMVKSLFLLWYHTRGNLELQNISNLIAFLDSVLLFRLVYSVKAH